jgi:hypothetical protein
MPIIKELRKQRQKQEDCKCEANPGHRVRSYLKMTNEKKKEKKKHSKNK